jgi:Alginate export
MCNRITRHWISAIIVSTGILTTPALADEAYSAVGSSVSTAQPVKVEPVPLQDPEAQQSHSDLPAETATPCSCCNSTCCTKKQKEAATAKMKGAYKCYEGPSFWGDDLKGLCDGKMDIGGELRMRYHSEKNHRGLGLTGRDDNFWLTRYRMFSNYRMNEYFRVYGEYLYADSGGETFNNRLIEENRGELQNLFLDTQLTEELNIRLGRQELQFGNQRLVSPLDWANTRRSFDGARGTYKGEVWTLDGFYVNPLNRTAANESKIDDADETQDFFGTYATRSDLEIGTVDMYYLGYTDSVFDFDYHTLGNRVAGETDGGLKYELEGGLQFGNNSPGFGNHSATFFTSGLGRELSVCTDCGEWNPIVWFWYDYASGGDQVPAARGDDGFDHLFPLAHLYNGFMDLFGRRNLHDINAQFITPVMGSKKVKMLLWYHYFLLDQATTPYNVTMTPFNAANPAGDKELGHEIDTLFTIDLNPRNSVQLGYSHFFAGDYYETTAGVPTNEDARFFYMQYQSRF